MAPASTSVPMVEVALWMAATNAYVPRVSCSCLLLLREILQDQQVGLTQAPIKLLLLPWVLECVKFCGCPLRVKSLSPKSYGTPEIKAHWPSKPVLWGLVFPVQDLQAGEPDVRLRPFTPLRESLQCNYSPVCGSPTQWYGTWIYS